MNLIEQIKVNDVSIDGYQGMYYSENPEWVRVILDSSNNVLAGIKVDGTVEWSAGVPTPIREYIEQQFKEQLDLKVDKEENKSLIDSSVAESMSIIESPEYIQVTTDREDKIVMGIKDNGAVYIPILENDSIDLKVDDAIERIDASVNEVLSDISKKVGPVAEYFSEIEDPEGRSEIKTDIEDKIISYRDDEGKLHENVGIETTILKANSFILPQDTKDEVEELIDNHVSPKKWYLPKFGKVNVKEETFYLDAGNWSSYDDVVLIQMYDDTPSTATQRKTLSYYYIKSTLTPLASGGYDRTSVNENSVQLTLHAGKDVVTIGNKYFAKTLWGEVVIQGADLYCEQINATPVTDPDTGEIVGYEYNGQSTEVKLVKDVPPYKAWKVYKSIEHYCIADIDFGTFYNKTNGAISIKYQGAGSTSVMKRGWRLTFYKNANYSKKDKVKIGEMVRISGYNMKSYGQSKYKIGGPILDATFTEVWETRGKDAFPWNYDSLPCNGATGMIKSFPIETWFGDEFFGIQYFGLKKDEKNYMLDGTDESGIFVCGRSINALNGYASDFDEEMLDEMSPSTTAALNEWLKYVLGFISGSIEIDGQVVPFENSMLEERIDILGFIDYWIGVQIFWLFDNTARNIVLHTREDKRKFFPFFYDLDDSFNYPSIDSDMLVVWGPGSGRNNSFWIKFTDVYKDLIINRYAELRKTVLTVTNITSIYNRYIEGITDEAIQREVSRWGSAFNPKNFINELTTIEERLEILDNNYFYL